MGHRTYDTVTCQFRLFWGVVGYLEMLTRDSTRTYPDFIGCHSEELLNGIHRYWK